MKFSILLLAMAFLFVGCESYEKDVISTHPSGLPSVVQLYKWKGNKKIIVKEIRYSVSGQKEMEGELTNGKKDGRTPVCTPAPLESRLPSFA